MAAETGKRLSKTKIFLAMAGAAYFVAAAAWGGHWLWQRAAQEPSGENLAAHPGRVQEILINREMEKIADKIGLDKEQKETVRKIIKETGVMEGPPMQMIQNLGVAREKIRGLLTPEQLEKMETLEKERMGQFSDRIVGTLRERLDLTDSQVEQVGQIIAGANPLNGQPQDNQPPLARMAQSREKIRELLTPEQQKKFDEMPRLFGGPGGGGFGRFFGNGRQQQEEQ